MTARWVIVGNPDGRRVTLFQAALRGLGQTEAAVVAWSDLLAGRTSLADVIRADDIIRIDSPGRDFDVERQLLSWGADEAEAEAGTTGGAFLPVKAIASLSLDRGAMLFPRQWYLGFRRALRTLIAEPLKVAPPHRLLNPPADITLFFDKDACHAWAQAHKMPVPPYLGIIRNYEDLASQLRRTGVHRVFLKLAHGSSASGVIAYRFNGRGQHQALTTVETAIGLDGQVVLYNTRQIRELTDPAAIIALVDALAPHRLIAEEWLPKATFPGCGGFDLRALTIAGKRRHVVGRCSQSPMTNLHLLNQRITSDRMEAHLGAQAWSAMTALSEEVAAHFPNSLHLGLDILFLPGLRRLALVEINAFGDLLPDAQSDGEDVYTAEIQAVQRMEKGGNGQWAVGAGHDVPPRAGVRGP